LRGRKRMGALCMCGMQMTVVELLNWSTNYLREHQIENPRLNAELLLAFSLSLSREGLYSHLKGPFKEEEKEAFMNLVKRRISGEPLQYIIGYKEFWSTHFRVDPRVFIPRPETELLVEQSLVALPRISLERAPCILEIGTGSGAIAISLAKEVKDGFIVATDISKEALLLAKENAVSTGVLHRITFINADLFGPFRLFRDGGHFDLVLSNPPYITRSEIEKLAREVKDYEPLIALDGGEEGIDFFERIVSQASFYLRKGGWLLLEVGQGQDGEVSSMIERVGDFNLPERVKDLSDIRRVVKAQRKQESRSLCLHEACLR
jgi:release factor glutamine methyltransferase